MWSEKTTISVDETTIFLFALSIACFTWGMSLASVSLILEFSSGFKECASPQIISQFYEPSVWVTQLRCITLMQLFWDISAKKFLKILCKLTLLTKQALSCSICTGTGGCLDRLTNAIGSTYCSFFSDAHVFHRIL